MDVQQFQENLLAKGKEAGFEEMEVYYEKSASFGCRVYNGELDHYETSENGGLSFRGMYNGQMGYAYTEKLDEESISFLLKSAKEIADVIEVEEVETIFEGSNAYEQNDWYSETLSNVTIPEKISLLLDIEKKIFEYSPKIISVNYCMLQDETKERALANSKGLSLKERHNYIVFYCSVVVKDGEETKSGFTIKLTRDFDTLNAEEIAKEAAEEALKNLGEQSIPNKKYPILFRNDTAAQFISTFSSIFSAEEAQQGHSLLKGKTGKKIAAEGITIIDDPFHPLGFAGRNFDGEGVASEKRTIVEKGKLNTLLHNRKTAKKDGVETTGHAHKPSYKGTISVAPSNFYVVPGEKSYEELVAGMKEGVIITNLSGLHSGADTVSGDFSVAAGGFYVKDGNIETPTKLMTIAGNFFTLLNDITEIGADLRFGPGSGMDLPQW